MKSLFSLKGPVLVGFLVFWIVGNLYAMAAGGGGLGGALTPAGAFVTDILALITSLLSLSVALFRRVQEKVVAPERADHFDAKAFYIFAFLMGLLALSRFFLPGA